MKRTLKPETVRTMAKCKLPLSEIVRLSGYSAREVEAIVAVLEADLAYEARAHAVETCEANDWPFR